MGVDVSDLDRADLLAALYNAATPVKLGFLHYDPRPWTREDAEALLRERDGQRQYFDYVGGRPLKVWLGEPTLDDSRYDAYHGEGTALLVVALLRTFKDPRHHTICGEGRTVLLRARAAEALEALDRPADPEPLPEVDGTVVLRLGVRDLVDPDALRAAVERALQAEEEVGRGT